MVFGHLLNYVDLQYNLSRIYSYLFVSSSVCVRNVISKIYTHYVVLL